MWLALLYVVAHTLQESMQHVIILFYIYLLPFLINYNVHFIFHNVVFPFNWEIQSCAYRSGFWNFILKIVSVKNIYFELGILSVLVEVQKYTNRLNIEVLICKMLIEMEKIILNVTS